MIDVAEEAFGPLVFAGTGLTVMLVNPATVLEVGAGAGNSAFPILQNSNNPRLKIHACDFSKKAVELIRAHEL